MRRIELRPDVRVPTADGERITVTHAKYLSDLVRGDGSFGVWPKTAVGLSILSKLASARGHVFLDDAEHAALLASLRTVHTLNDVAFAGADAGWQHAIEDAEEWVEKDGQIVRKG